jgi:hypothetical protein
MSVCRNCHRESKADVGCYAGPFFFCSFLCRDTSEVLRDYQAHLKEFPKQRPQTNCGIPNCHVCSGAMRERAGKGDDT